METHHYFKLYKPYGYISQFITNDRHAQSKKLLGSLYDFPEGIMAVGRLDESSEGLLLLTTDGVFSHDISKGKKVEKEYYAQVDGIISSEAIEQLENGVEIGINGKTYITKPSTARLIQAPNLPPSKQRIRDDRHGPTSWVSIIVKEGKFRQIRKMTSAVGFPTLRLVRVRVGSYTIDNMDCGAVEKIEPLNF